MNKDKKFKIFFVSFFVMSILLLLLFVTLQDTDNINKILNKNFITNIDTENLKLKIENNKEDSYFVLITRDTNINSKYLIKLTEEFISNVKSNIQIFNYNDTYNYSVNNKNNEFDYYQQIFNYSNPYIIQYYEEGKLISSFELTLGNNDEKTIKFKINLKKKSKELFEFIENNINEKVSLDIKYKIHKEFFNK